MLMGRPSPVTSTEWQDIDGTKQTFHHTYRFSLKIFNYVPIKLEPLDVSLLLPYSRRYLISGCHAAGASNTWQFINGSTRLPRRSDPWGPDLPSLPQFSAHTQQLILKMWTKYYYTMHFSGTMKPRMPTSCHSYLLSRRNLADDNTR